MDDPLSAIHSNPCYPVRRILATAPIRICDNGGWTDTWVARHGKVFNIAVRPVVAVRIDVFPRGTREAHVVLNADNYRLRYAPNLDQPGWGPHPLLEAAVRANRPPSEVDVEITIRSDAPAGASTGTSASVVVALLGALDRLTANGRTPSEIAREAHAVETAQLGRQSGVQDQLCAAHGGVNFIDIPEYPRATVTRLPLAEDVHRELDRRLVLVYLGHPHQSSEVHERVVRDLEQTGPDCAPLNDLRRAAEDARDAVVAGDLDALGRAMRNNTTAQAALHGELIQPESWRVIEIAAAHGAIGWKVNGAGGDGGSMTLLSGSRDDDRRAMTRAIVAANPAFAHIPTTISLDGLHVQDEAVRP